MRRWWRLDRELVAVRDEFRQRTSIAHSAGLPLEWKACACCNETSWVFPPHGSQPCPLVVQIAEQLGLKFDAERMQAVRTGVNMEEIARQMRSLAGDDE